MPEPARRFLAPNGRTVTQPLREPPTTRDATETVELIASATRLIDEPECPSRNWCDAQADLARTYDLLRHAAEIEQREQARSLLTIEQRMNDAHQRAKHQRIDVTRELHACRLMLERAQRGGRDTPPAAVRKLEQAGARLDHRPDLTDLAA